MHIDFQEEKREAPAPRTISVFVFVFFLILTTPMGVQYLDQFSRGRSLHYGGGPRPLSPPPVHKVSEFVRKKGTITPRVSTSPSRLQKKKNCLHQRGNRGKLVKKWWKIVDIRCKIWAKAQNLPRPRIIFRKSGNLGKVGKWMH